MQFEAQREKFAGLIKGVIDALPDWSVVRGPGGQPEIERDTGQMRHGTGARVWLHIYNGRMEFRIQYPRDEHDQFQSARDWGLVPYGEDPKDKITVAAFRGAEAIAKSFRSRLEKRAIEFWNLANEKRAARIDAKIAGAKLLKELTGEKSREQKEHIAYVSGVGPKGTLASAKVTVRYDLAVEMELRHLSADKARRIMEVLREPE